MDQSWVDGQWVYIDHGEWYGSIMSGWIMGIHRYGEWINKWNYDESWMN